MHLKNKQETFNFEVLLNWIELCFFFWVARSSCGLSLSKTLDKTENTWSMSSNERSVHTRGKLLVSLPSLIPFAHCSSRQRRLQYDIFVFDQTQQHFLEMNELTGNAALWVTAHFGEALLSLFPVYRWIWLPNLKPFCSVPGFQEDLTLANKLRLLAGIGWIAYLI